MQRRRVRVVYTPEEGRVSFDSIFGHTNLEAWAQADPVLAPSFGCACLLAAWHAAVMLLQ
jgi:hypothetical protein